MKWTIISAKKSNQKLIRQQNDWNRFGENSLTRTAFIPKEDATYRDPTIDFFAFIGWAAIWGALVLGSAREQLQIRELHVLH
jgi:hypothetical protein